MVVSRISSIARGGRMKRREFIAALGGAVAWPLAARAQQSKKIVGVLQSFEPTNPPVPVLQAFLKRLRELGWIEGQNLIVEYRGAPTIDRMTELAADLVRMKVDVILAPATPQVEAASRVTKKIPIVFASRCGTRFELGPPWRKYHRVVEPDDRLDGEG